MQSFPPVGGGPIITPDDVKIIVEDIVLFCVMPTFLFMIFVYFYFRQIKQRRQIRNKSVHTELEISPPLYENNNETKFKSMLLYFETNVSLSNKANFTDVFPSSNVIFRIIKTVQI